MSHQHLMNELQSMHDATIISQKDQSFPVFTVTLLYRPIQKTPMDILMKMMLIAFQKAPIKAPTVLANILIVEPLFIEDLTNKMMAASLIEIAEDGTYQLTEKGQSQLAAGIFEEQMDTIKEEVLYSALHENIVYGDFDSILEMDDIPEPLPYVKDELETFHDENVIESLEQSNLETDSETAPVFIQSIDEYEVGTIHDIPITIFVLKENRSDRIFVRVFNHYSNDWDHILEQVVTENEKSNWKDIK